MWLLTKDRNGAPRVRRHMARTNMSPSNSAPVRGELRVFAMLFCLVESGYLTGTQNDMQPRCAFVRAAVYSME